MAAERMDDSELLLQHLSQDIKALQAEQCSSSYAGDVTTRSRRANELCEHLDMILMHKLVSHLPAYWMFVCQFTHSETLKTIRQLPQVTTDRGRGRAWLLLALNEQSIESYIRSFQQNRGITAQFYESSAIMRSKDKLVLLQTLLAGLEYIVFNLSLDFPYLDVATCDPSVATKIKKNFVRELQPQEPGTSPIPISNPVSKTGSQDDAFKLSVCSTQESAVREMPADTISDPQPQSKSWEGSLPKASGLKNSGKENVGISLGSHLEKPLRLAQRGPDAVLLTDSGYSSVDCSPSPHPLLQDLDSFNVVSLKGGRPRAKEGKKASSRKGGAKGKRPTIIAEAPAAHQSAPEEAAKQDPELSASRQAVAVLDAKQVVSEGETTQVFQHEVADNEAVGEDGSKLSKGMEARVGSPASEVSPSSELNQPEHDVQQQEEQISFEPEPVREEKAELGLQSSEYMSAPVAGVQWMATEEEHHVETTDGGEGEVVDAVAEKPLSVEGSEGGQQLPEKEVGDGREEDDVSETGGEGSGQFESVLDNVEQTDKGSSLDHYTTDVLSFGVPKRPMTITKQDKFATEVLISQNNKLLLSLNVCFDTSEELHKLLQVYRFAGLAVLQVCYVLITNEAVYILEDSESEAGYSRLTGARLKDLEDIQVGLNWQSLTLVYGCPPEHHMVVTCNEPVTRGVIECITDMSSKQSPRRGRINMSKGDKARWKALEQILPLESETDVQLYSIAYWEQLDGTMPPPCLFPTSASAKNLFRTLALLAFVDLNLGDCMYGLWASKTGAVPLIQGPLLVKSNKFGVPYWKPSFFALSEDALLQYNSEVDSTIRAKYPIQISTFGGCKRLAKEGRANAFMVTLAGTEFTFATKTEAEMIKWMQAICEAATVQVAGGVTLGGRYGILLTADTTHVLQEDWQAQKIEQLTCCQLEDVEHIGWDPDLPLYCVLNYDNTESPSGVSGSWLFCFSSPFELGKFETTVAQLWQEKMQIELEFNVITSESIKKRAREAIDLLHASKHRSDSVTKGREFIKPQL